MTRDEAIKTAKDAWPKSHPVAGFGGSIVAATPLAADTFVDLAVALGMLKLDEQKSLDARLAAALGWPEHGRSHGELTVALDAAGLKIVEK